jgi:Domain of unknown function (DUF4189)
MAERPADAMMVFEGTRYPEPEMKMSAASWRCVLVIALAVTLQSQAGKADGAIATTPPQDVYKDGFNYGVAIGYATSDQATARALQECRKRATVNRGTRQIPDRCKIVQTFRGECVAVAMDPKDGSPGIGWAVERTVEKAQAAAMAKCRATAGDGGQSCRLERGPGLGCDRR